MSSKKFIEVAFNVPVDATFTYFAPQNPPANFGYRVLAKFGRRELEGFVVNSTDIAPSGEFEIKDVLDVVDEQPFFDENQIELAKWISQTYFCTFGEAISSILPSAKKEAKSEYLKEQEFSDYKERILSEEQEFALNRIFGSEQKYFYLYGITGSGKTEVFLQAAKRVIELGKSVIYLVPEIALTHQLISDVFLRFEGSVAILHSSLSPQKRLIEWNKIRRGEAKLIIGARSAIFAPAKNLGLIIIDEEHEGTYKSGSTPRYHARQIAMHLSSLDKNLKVVLGSATPSVESFHAMATGRFEKLELTKRLSGGAMPKISVVDMNNESSAISKILKKKILEVKSQGKQTILFLNRKGFNYFFHCKSCGYQMVCKNCSVSLTYYKTINMMKCNYCGYTRPPLQSCPQCNSLDVGYSGFGTELVEQEITQLFPNFSVARIDSQIASKKGVLEKILKEFREGKIDLLLGTQIVAKGLNFPGVKLVGVVLADTGLYLPDFRASERTFSLITQVAGRAGRFSPDGEVIIQSYSPSATAIDLAAKSEIDKFYKEELDIRSALKFPPFTRLARIVFRSKVKDYAVKSASDFSTLVKTHFIEKNLFPSLQLLGPVECPLAIVNKNFRYQVILRCETARPILIVLKSLKEALASTANYYVEIDIDPISLL